MSWHNNPRIVTRDLLLLLDAKNIKSYPGSGVLWNDISGKANHANSQVSAVITANRWNSSGYFDLNEGDNLHFLIPTLNNYNFYGEISVDVWLKNTGGDYRTVIQNDDNALSSSDSIALRFGREDFYGGANNGTRASFVLNSETGVTFPVSLNVWENLQFTFDGDFIRVYINGVLFTSTAYTTHISQVPYDLKLFRYYNTGEDMVNPVARIAIYSSFLTDSEVLQNFDALKGRFGL